MASSIVAKETLSIFGSTSVGGEELYWFSNDNQKFRRISNEIQDTYIWNI
jgi:hypothetical protein